jgi:tetratricopeptide (TPR) repeat protein
MKSTINFMVKMLSATFLMLLLVQSGLLAQEKMPITTSSDEARDLFREGRAEVELMNYREAIPLLEKAIKKDPSFALAYMYLAQAKGEGSTSDKQTMKKAVELAENVTKGERHLIMYANAIREENEEAILKHRDVLMELYPDDERIALWAGWHDYVFDNYDKAIEYFERSLAINNDYHLPLRFLGYTYMEKGEMEMAENYMRQYVEMLPKNAAANRSFADLLRNMGKLDESIEYSKKAIDIDPRYVASYKGIGDSYLFKGDYETARNYYREYQENAQHNNQKFYGLVYVATTYLHEDEPEKAMKVMDKYLSLADELNMPIFKIYGTGIKSFMFTETDQSDKGLIECKKIPQLISTTELTDAEKKQHEIVYCLREFHALTFNNDINKAEKAKARCTEQLEDGGTTGNWRYFNRIAGVLEMKKGNYDKAKDYLANAWNVPITWYYIGLTYDKEGNKDKAKKYYKKVMNHYSNYLELAVIRNKAVAALEE